MRLHHTRGLAIPNLVFVHRESLRTWYQGSKLQVNSVCPSLYIDQETYPALILMDIIALLSEVVAGGALPGVRAFALFGSTRCVSKFLQINRLEQLRRLRKC
jgi:hypothetical protein